MKIGDKIIGKGASCFIIAEAGVNHNGDVKIAKKLVDMAKDAGADAIKFQTYKTENLVTKYAKMADYQSNNLGKKEMQFNMLKKLELSYKEFIELKHYCDSKEILFMSTPFDKESAKFLDSIGVKAFKISSGDLTNIPLLEYISSFNKPIILSSGMSVLGEIEEAINCIRNKEIDDIAVLHCTSNYPAPLDSVNLKAMNNIKRTFDVISGYSDHTKGIIIPIAARALGAEIIEKHFTLDKNMDGPDHKASLDPNELKEMIHSIRNLEIALGNGIKSYTESELNTMRVARKSIVASRKMEKGSIISVDDLDYKRPGTGLSPKYYKEFVDKKLVKDVEKDEQLTFSCIKN